MFYVYRRIFRYQSLKDHKPLNSRYYVLLLISVIISIVFIIYTVYTTITNNSINVNNLVNIDNLRQNTNKKVEIEIINGCLQSIPEVDKGPHIVSPPAGPVTLVCCHTTAGPLNIAVHPTWAPIGAKNFLNMVQTGFFSSKVGLFRAIKDFLVQFGLAGDPKVQKDYESKYLDGKGGLVDDPQWLPEGPPGRNINGVYRFQAGYISYAGAGKDSRGTQLFIANKDSLYLGGGSPWEVPFGQLVGKESYNTLMNIYTGYDEKISQGKIRNRGNQYLESEFPELDYIESCQITTDNLLWKYEPIEK